MTKIFTAIVNDINDTAMAFTSREKAVEFCKEQLVELMEEMGKASIYIEAEVQNMDDAFAEDDFFTSRIVDSKFFINELELA